MRPNYTTADSRNSLSKRFVTRRNILKALVSSGLIFCERDVFSKDMIDADGVSDISETLLKSADALAARQNEDGSFGSRSELFGRDPAVSALCGLSFLALGSLPGRGRYGRELDRIVDFILSRSLKTSGKTTSDAFSSFDASIQTATLDYLHENNLSLEDLDGLIADLSEKGCKPVYGHGFATLFLAEVSGATQRPEIRETARSAVNLIARIQNGDGGWRYEPRQASVADISVTTCQLSALRSARNAGLLVPVETIVAAERFILSLQNRDGGFRYTKNDGPSGYSRTAAAIHALQSSDVDATESIERAFEYLKQIYPVTGAETSNTEKIEYWSYGQFYAALSYWRATIDDNTRERSRLFFRRFTNDALARRDADGLWRSPISSEAETAFILCALSVPKERLPIFIR